MKEAHPHIGIGGEIVPSSSSLFHKASKMRERSGVWSHTLQPVMYPTDIHGGCSHDVLKMGSRLPNVTRPPQTHRPHSLGMDSFYTCSLSIFLLELFCLLSLSGNI